MHDFPEAFGFFKGAIILKHITNPKLMREGFDMLWEIHKKDKYPNLIHTSSITNETELAREEK